MAFSALKKIFNNTAIAKEDLDRWSDQAKFTPDIAYLSRYKWQWFLITDDMMKGRRSHNLLKTEDAQFYGTVYTQDSFIMMKKNLGKATYPVLLQPNGAAGGRYRMYERAPVMGELWKIRPHHINALDTHRLNTVEFTRRRVKIDIPYQKKYEKFLGFDGKGNKVIEYTTTDWLHDKSHEAWLYVGDFDYWMWSNFTDNTFSKVKVIEPNNKELSNYYYYTYIEDIKQDS